MSQKDRITETLEQMHKVLTDHHQAIKDLQRLVSVLDTRLDRWEYHHHREIKELQRLVSALEGTMSNLVYQANLKWRESDE